MRLHELLNERADQASAIAAVLQTGKYIDEDGMHEIQDFEEFNLWLMVNYDLKNIGKGVYSVAVAGSSDPEYILKYNHNSNFAKEDKWLRFAKVAKRNSEHNSLFPKILWSGTRWGIGIGIMEYLKVDGNEIDRLIPEWDNTMDNIVYISSLDLPFEKLNTAIREKDIQYLLYFLKTFDISYDKLMEFWKLVNGLGNMDAHGENVGWRKDGSFVIFDPVS